MKTDRDKVEEAAMDEEERILEMEEKSYSDRIAKWNIKDDLDDVDTVEEWEKYLNSGGPISAQAGLNRLPSTDD